MPATVRVFFELLPYRIEQALGWRAIRAAWIRRSRRRAKVSRKSSASAASDRRRRLVLDLAIISRDDAGTGIQRVVRALASALLREAPADWDIQFVGATRKRRYHIIAWSDRVVNDETEVMQARPGDVFVGLDYSLDAVRRHRHQLAAFRDNGGSLWFLVHDLLPLNRPEWFSRNTIIRFHAWLAVLAELADGFLCNSEQTEIELREALAAQFGLTEGYRTQVLPMGHGVLDPGASHTLAGEAPPQRFGTNAPFVLMVGTLEPRKGHADVIAAFDELWRRGSDERLVLVGRIGWAVDALSESIVHHPEFGGRLLWFDDVDDAELFTAYEACAGLIIASHGEGFGLPLIEALGHGKPVLARDLPVFRSHAEKGVRYFPAAASPAVFADEIVAWLDVIRSGAAVVQRPTQSWPDAARLLLATIEGGA